MEKKILLIEDDPSLCKIYRTIFESQGWQVDEAYDGKVGLTKALHASPDIVLLDLMLPVMNGFDVLKVLKETETTKNIPVVMITNLSNGNEAEEAKLLGAADCLSKSENTPDEILKKVKTIIIDSAKQIPSA